MTLRTVAILFGVLSGTLAGTFAADCQGYPDEKPKSGWPPATLSPPSSAHRQALLANKLLRSALAAGRAAVAQWSHENEGEWVQGQTPADRKGVSQSSVINATYSVTPEGDVRCLYINQKRVWHSKVLSYLGSMSFCLVVAGLFAPGSANLSESGRL